jgi:predicted nuclease of predicted toxin-antitoxin system
VKLATFKLLNDENIDPEVFAGLRSLGFDVADVVESDRQASSDTELIRWAYSMNRAVVSHDADFGTLAILRGEPVVGLIFLRPGHINPEFTLGTIRSVVAANVEVQPPFGVVAKRTGDNITIRIRALNWGRQPVTEQIS